MVFPRPQHGTGSRTLKHKALVHPNFANWKWGVERELSPSPDRHREEIHSIVDQFIDNMDRRPGIGRRAEGNWLALRSQAGRLSQEEFDHRLNMQAQDLAVHHPRIRGLPGPPIVPNEAFRGQLGNRYLSSTSNVAANLPAGYPPMLERSLSYPTGSRYPQTSANRPQPPQSSIIPPHMSESQSSTMATRANDSRHHRRDRISSSDVANFAERAARRNASGSFEPKVNDSESRESHLPDDVFGINSPFPQISLQQATFLSANRSTRSGFTLHQAPSQVERAARPRNVNRGLGYDLGLNSNMPSQLPRNPQEAAAAAAARQHATRVRSMQRILASDPNVMMPRAPGPPSQLVAIGPPLTGHNTITATTLPSVLNPISRQPLMSYKQGLQALFAETGPLLMRLTQLDSCSVSVVLYDTAGRALTVSEGLVLTKDTDIQAVVTFIQVLLDETTQGNPTHDGSRLVVKDIDIRVGTTDATQGYPPLKGVNIQGERGKWARWIRWTTHSDMEKYWEAYRIMLQTQVPKNGNTNTGPKPIFKVNTVVQLNNNGFYPGGHQFCDVPNDVVPPTPTIVAYGYGEDEYSASLERANGGADTSSEVPTSSFASRSDIASQVTFTQGPSVSDNTPQSALHQEFGQRQLQLPLFDGSASNPDSRSGGSRSDGGEAATSTASKGNAKTVDPTKNWGYYQRMGGDPRNHKLYDLSHVPFDVKVENLPAPIPDPFTTPDILVRIRDAWSDNDTEGSATPKASDGDGRASYAYVEAPWRELAAKQFEAAISFEDDDVFFPNADIKLPTPNDILAARLFGNSKQNGKGRVKDPATSHFFNDHRTPDGSQDYLLGVPGYSGAVHGSQGKADEAGANSPYGGYSAPIGTQDNRLGFSGYDVPDYEGKRQAKHVDGQVSNSYDRYMDQNYQSLMAAAGTTTSSNNGTPLSRVSSMNVHATPFSNASYPQASQELNINTLSPYLHSLAGDRAAEYSRPSPYSQMTGQAKSDTPVLRYPSPSTAGAQAGPIKKSNSALALHAPEFKPTYSSQTLYPQTAGSSILQHSPESSFDHSNASSVPRPIPGMFAHTAGAPRHSSPDKTAALNTAGLPERPDKRATQKSSTRRKKSPAKAAPSRQEAAQAAAFRFPSPDKSIAQQSFGASTQYSHDTSAGSMMQYPIPNNNFPFNSNFPAQQGQESSYVFGTQVSGQGSVNNGGQSAMQGGPQGPYQGGAQGSGHARGGSWIYRRGGKMPKQEFGF